jgi:hypothetical protein
VSYIGRKQNSNSTPEPTQTPDTLRSKDTLEVILGMCEGKVRGPWDGTKSIYVGTTVLQNPDGTFNFSDFEINFWPGDAIAAPIKPKLGGVANNAAVGVTLFSGTPVVRSTTTGMIDYIDVRILIPQLLITNTKGTFTNTVTFMIEYKAASASTWTPIYTDNSGHIAITGKTTSTYVKEFRFAVKQISEVYQVRVTKITAENTVTDFSTISWESFQEITALSTTHNNTAILQIVGQATDQFSSIPDFWADMGGFCELKIPTNYDPVAKTYAGVWDGSFKLGWTDNPALILYNYITNDSWGMSRFTPMVMDKFSVYEAAQWCDTMVDNGHGGTQARYTFNMLVSEVQSGTEFARYLAGTFNAAYLDDQNGSAYIKVDKDDAATHLFAPENVADGMFNYTYSDTTERYNDLTVVWNNKDLVGYAQDRRRVFSQPEIDKNGRIPLDFIAVGCVDEHEALRRATYKLITATTEVTTVNFRTNRQGRYVNAFDVILISDPTMGWGISGRIKSIDPSRFIIYPRDPIFLEAGITYSLKIKTPTAVISRTLPFTTGGYATQLITDPSLDPLPANLPANAVFEIEQAGAGIGAPKPFRVVKVIPVDGDKEAVEITAIEINRNKWAGADAATPVGTVQYGFVAGFGSCAPPTSVEATRVIVPAGSGSQTDIHLSWVRSPDKLVTRYHVLYSFNGGPYVQVLTTKENVAEMGGVAHGKYDIEVTAEKYGGTFSAPALTTITILEESSIAYAQVTGLALVAGLTSTTFGGRDASFTWNLNAANFTGALAAGTVPAGYGYLDPSFLYYVARVYDPATNTLIYTENCQTNSFVFTFEKNAHCTGGPYRSFRVEIGLKDRYDVLSTFTALTVSNPAPPSLTGLSITAAFKSIFVDYNQPAETDWRGIQVWMAGTTGFTPGAGNLVFDGQDSLIVLPATAGTPYFLRLAAYDLFGKTGLNVSSEFTVTTSLITGTDIAPLSIDGTKFASGLSVPVIVSALPGTGTEGQTAVLTTDGKFYRYHSGAWVNTVPTTDISGQITTTQITPNAITTALIATDSITSVTIQAGAITTAKIAASAVTANEIHADAVTSVKIVANAITAAHMQADSILAASIKAGEIHATHLAADSVTAVAILAGTITGDKINGNLFQGNSFVATNPGGDYVQMYGGTSGGSGPYFSVVDNVGGSHHLRVIVGNYLGDIGLHVWNSAGVKTFTAGDMQPSVVATTHLQANAATVPVVATLGGPVTGTGAGVFITVIPSFTVTLGDAGKLYLLGNFNQGFTGSGVSRAWAFNIYVDGSLVGGGSGGVFNDLPTISWAGAVAAGSHTVRVDWASETTVTLGAGTINAVGYIR